MSSWNHILNEIKSSGTTHDIVRRKYIKKMYNKTGRNVIIYYSGWLQKPGIQIPGINDNDKNGFMTTIQGLDRDKGLDLFLHTPGGEIAATESIVEYLKSMFGNDIRAIVPQIAMSAGTMIACACKSVVMGKPSNLGPIDPQFNGVATHGVIEEFQQAWRECKEDKSKIPIWQPIIAKYPPTFVGECQKAIEWSEELLEEWLAEGMFSEDKNRDEKITNIVKYLSNHSERKTHARHISIDDCKNIGLKIETMEDDQKLQDAILSVHHATIHTLSATGAIKIIENQMGKAFIQTT